MSEILQIKLHNGCIHTVGCRAPNKNNEVLKSIISTPNSFILKYRHDSVPIPSESVLEVFSEGGGQFFTEFKENRNVDFKVKLASEIFKKSVYKAVRDFEDSTGLHISNAIFLPITKDVMVNRKITVGCEVIINTQL